MSNSQYMNVYMKQRYQHRRQEAILFLGGNCHQCGGVENLQFHHKDQSTKSFTISRGSSRSHELFWAEVKKCILLCVDCHHTHHASNYPCGTPQKYWRGCHCVECTQANNDHAKEYKRRKST